MGAFVNSPLITPHSRVGWVSMRTARPTNPGTSRVGREIDPEARTARVEPGVILTDLQKAAAPHGLRFGPDPSTQARATLGGMIGNNACGPRAVAYGRTADNVVDLDVIDGLGRRFTAGRGLEPVPGLDALVRANMETLRTELGRFGRQVSGYSLELGYELSRAAKVGPAPFVRYSRWAGEESPIASEHPDGLVSRELLLGLRWSFWTPEWH